MSSTETPPDPIPEDQLPPERAALVALEKALARFAGDFEASAKRWERLVYPSILIFGILGISGFYLIYSLTEDMHTLSRHVDPQMSSNLESMSRYMAVLSENVTEMNHEVRAMVRKVDSIDTTMANMRYNIAEIQTVMVSIDKKLDPLQPILVNMIDMNQAMRAMTMNTGMMTRDMGIMNQSVSRPMSFMNAFAPW